MKFESEYKKLNKEQKEAVDAIEGPVMVIAGPGTGKTQILTLRIANILKIADIEPEAILALTFTESGVASMRRRLIEMIGPTAYSVTISTFHGFCNDIIKNYPEEFPKIIGSQNITEVGQINLIEKAIFDLPLKDLKPFGDQSFYVKDILKAINDLKREGVDENEFANIIEKEKKYFNNIDDLYHEKGAHKGQMKGEYQRQLKQINKNEELFKVYEYYQINLFKTKQYDYSDMIMEVLRELRQNKNLLLQLQEKYQYFLVDEHQDTNNAQNKVLELLCNYHKNPNIFVVGDEKQAIFRFQGASLENFNYFKKLYPEAKIIILDENYRSSQTILDSAHSLTPSSKNLRANVKYAEKKINLYGLSKADIEIYFISSDINEKIKKGIKPEEIAIIFRDNKDALPISMMFEKMNIPFVIESDQNIMSDNDIKKLILLMRVVNEFGSPEQIAEALHIDFLKIASLDIYKIINTAYKLKKSIYEIIRDKKILTSSNFQTPKEIYDFYFKLAGWATMRKNLNVDELFEIIVRESGFLTYILKKVDATEKVGKLNGLFDEIRSLNEKHANFGLSDFVQYLDTLESHNLLIKKTTSISYEGAVRLMTAHKSKGQEFDYVYIANAYDGHWGNKRISNMLRLPESVYYMPDSKINSQNQNDDERRLFYVAITRAKKEVIISYSKESLSSKDQLPSVFVQEIRSDLINSVDTMQIENNYSKSQKILYTSRNKTGVGIKDKKFVRQIFLDNGLSVTALNNYLKCPWNYFYTNLLRLPQAKTKHQLYGTTVHEALRDYFLIFGKSSVANKKYLLDRFKFYLEKQQLKNEDFEPVLKKGLKALGGYFDKYSGSWSKNVLVELSIPAVMLTKDIRITGKIDKIEFLKNNEVNVVDYKTGKPKTRGEIEGKTKNSEGDIKRQLVFYNLLVNKFKSGKYKMISGEIDFIEPDEKGRYKKEMFVVDKNEIKELERTIRRISDEILNLSFWDKKCDDKKCEFCKLREKMN